MARGSAAGSSRDGAVLPGGPPLVRIGPFGPTHPARYRVVTPEEQAAADYYAAEQLGGAHLGPPPQQAPQAWLTYGQGPGAPRQERDRPQPVYRTSARDTKPLDADRDQAQWCCPGCNLLNWPSRRRCRECKRRRTGEDPREWALQGGRTSSPPRSHRRRDSGRRATSSPPSPPSVERPRSQDGRTAGAGASPNDKRAATVREALASLKLAQAPAAVLGPLQAELERLEAAAREARPVGQRLDAARAAMRRAGARLESTAAGLAAATERHDKAAQHHAACAEELAALEEELRTGQTDNQVDDLAEAVEAALRNPAAAYSHATLQAAYARYAENKMGKGKGEKDVARSPPKTAPKAVRSPVAKRQPAPLSPNEARDVASAANAALTLALADRSAMEEDGQGNGEEEMEEPDAAGAKRLRQAGGPGQ